jgi:tRNA pseudouridine(38-40) synthase
MINNSESCELSRSGWTDKGVSALGQVFAVKVRNNPNIDYVKCLNRLLPKEIWVLCSKQVNS